MFLSLFFYQLRHHTGNLPKGITIGLEIRLLTENFLVSISKRIYGWEPCDKIQLQLRSWYKMPSKLLRLRLHVSRHPEMWIYGCQRSGYLRTFSEFTRVQTFGCIVRGILPVCRKNTQMHCFGKLHAFKLSSIFSLFLLMYVGWTTRSKPCLVNSVIE